MDFGQRFCAAVRSAVGGLVTARTRHWLKRMTETVTGSHNERIELGPRDYLACRETRGSLPKTLAGGLQRPWELCDRTGFVHLVDQADEVMAHDFEQRYAHAEPRHGATSTIRRRGRIPTPLHFRSEVGESSL